MLHLRDFRSVICLNGNLPEDSFFQVAIDMGIPVVGADGGAKLLLNRGIKPAFVVGDMDTVGCIQVEGVETVFVEDQNYTDFEKSLFFVQRKDMLPTLVVGVNGGEIDHVLNNIATFVRYSEKMDMWFYDYCELGRNKIGRSVQRLDCAVEDGANVSLFAFDEGKVVTEGMKWEVRSESLHFMRRSGARNRSVGNKVKLSTSGKKLLAVIDSKVTY